MANPVVNTTIGLGLELTMLALAAGLANISPETGNIMVVFIVGILIIWLMFHTAITGAIPVLMTKAQQGAL